MRGFKPSLRLQIALALLAVYLVWGSTYVAIRIGVSSLPPALLAGVRFSVAGVLLLGYARWRGMVMPSGARQWRGIAVMALLMPVAANGLVTWAAQTVESSQVALLGATTALWLAGLGSLVPGAERPSGVTLLGLLLGLAGVAVLMEAGLAGAAMSPLPAAAVVLSPLLWACGSVYSLRWPLGCSPVVSASFQFLIAGVVMSCVGLAGGELARWHSEPRALAALAYLAVFGSCIAHASYLWLVPRVRPALLGTYAYVNPAIAVLLGVWVLGEALSAAQLMGSAVILGAVALVTLGAQRGRATRRAQAAAAERERVSASALTACGALAPLRCSAGPGAGAAD
jgi:drug/metabolite transporter (DMT)-like permease